MEPAGVRRSWRIALFLVGALALRGVLASTLFRAALAMGARGVSNEASALIAMLCDGAVMAALALAGMTFLGLKRSSVFPTACPRKTLFAAGALGVLLPAVNYWIVTRYFPSATSASSGIATYLSGKESVASLGLGLGLIVFAPLVEEIYFRGLLQGVLEEVSAPAAMLVATLLFINGHVGALTSPAMWILGAALGLVYHHTRSVSATVTCHVVNNVIALVALPLLTR
jgi:membrane protease YdiL (CAAX protease family)